MEPDDLQIAGFLFESVQPAFQSFVTDGSTTIVGIIAAPAVVLLTIYVLFWGVSMASGQISDTFTDGMKRIVRMCVIIGFALTTGIYQSTVVEFFMQAPMEIAGQIAIPGSDPIGDDINSMSTMLDQAAASGFDVAAKPWQEGIVMHSAALTGVSGEGLLFQGVAILLSTIVVLTVAIAACLILVAYSALTILLAIGPLFILLALFPGTMRWFESWLGQVVNYAIGVLLIVLAASLMFKVLDTFFQHMATMGTAEVPDGFPQSNRHGRLRLGRNVLDAVDCCRARRRRCRFCKWIRRPSGLPRFGRRQDVGHRPFQASDHFWKQCHRQSYRVYRRWHCQSSQPRGEEGIRDGQEEVPVTQHSQGRLSQTRGM